ncbi:MAG: hypothetical protein U9R05_05235 [Chloroflexota bacterium]|nr:hypothetical protein [Chloroflexota bacterium]
MRPSLERLRNAAFTGTFKHLLMLDVDRLSFFTIDGGHRAGIEVSG